MKIQQLPCVTKHYTPERRDTEITDLIALALLVPNPRSCQISKAKLGLDHSFQDLERLSVKQVELEMNHHIIMIN